MRRVDEHAVGGLALTAVTRDCVAVVEMRIVSDVERDRAARIKTDLQTVARVDLLDGA